MKIINSNAIITAYVDLKAIQRLLLNLRKNEEFKSTHVYSLLRDVCLIIDEVIDAFFIGSIDVDERVSTIRNHVHLYIKKRGQNQKMYRKILDYHIEAYGDDVNNIGFYLNNNGEVVGSTLYAAYILLDTDNLPFPMIEESARINERNFSFAKYIGELSNILANSIEKEFEIEIAEKIGVIEEIYNETTYECKDIHHKDLFVSDSDLTNTFILRLLFSLQEISDVIWLRDRYIAKLTQVSFVDLYILLRLTTLKTDEIMDNLLNIKQHAKELFYEWNSERNGEVEELLRKYEQEMQEECSTIRNMIHYDVESKNVESNFVGYLNNKISRESNYLVSTINKIIDLYLRPLRYEILCYLKIEEIKSLSDWEMIMNRLSKL
ncbi:hypothetical protein [Bacillus thuringiensis]|uniref:hypothetical protein n=1 Tax=Bacillus thuringiensis TaxID=1428 RepID=UPI000B4370B9|nr:hypothetical protein [Bacillus thuringiensis]MED3183410.1 hypothetical protein [Bacillus thuringiensis]OTY05646.1 hypothetical protein BK734_22595 [Bacillus thuringiensis serovar kim]OUB14633.1 hypothetical protein BK733_23745 [Bacillus thuringiensis serovar xiaguangiensis]